MGLPKSQGEVPSEEKCGIQPEIRKHDLQQMAKIFTIFFSKLPGAMGKCRSIPQLTLASLKILPEPFFRDCALPWRLFITVMGLADGCKAYDIFIDNAKHSS